MFGLPSHYKNHPVKLKIETIISWLPVKCYEKLNSVQQRFIVNIQSYLDIGLVNQLLHIECTMHSLL